MSYTALWLGIAAVMALIEAFSLGLFTLWFVVGALAAFLASLLGASIPVQVVVFLVVSVLCLVLLRPVIVKNRKRGKAEEASVIGKTGKVVEDIDAGKMSGRVELSDRVSWMARSADGSEIGQGQAVRVVDRESITLIVEAIASSEDREK